jgi:hypothetical protein
MKPLYSVFDSLVQDCVLYGSRETTNIYLYKIKLYFCYDGAVCVYRAVECVCSLHEGVYLDTGRTLRVLNFDNVWTLV